MTDYSIRSLESYDELRDCVALQEETWGEAFPERVPPSTLKVAQILGGLCAGAFDRDGSLVGFVFGMTGVRDGEIVHWSDMLAVKRGIRDTGLGTRLKAYQRSVMLERGITKVHWTFDPLQSRNAYLNFSKLGIVVREYVRDMYGDTDSPLRRGIGTDRFVALWPTDSERVRRRMEGRERGPGSEVLGAYPAALGASHPEGDRPRSPGRVLLGLDDAVVSVAIPADVSALMAESMELAVAWRQGTRTALMHYMGRGYEVRELVRDAHTSHYLLFRGSHP
jgi:predicted GNAT superfamily acetyltransferase